MRVVAGRFRSRQLEGPRHRGTRPTSDRVREAIFDLLVSRLGPGGLAGALVWDLFAGTGALGIEALSRGARQVVFVERDPRAQAVLLANLRRLVGAEQVLVARSPGILGRRERPGPGAAPEGAARQPEAIVVPGSVARWLQLEGKDLVDLVLCDPPYVFAEWTELLRGLAPRVRPGGLVVLESSRPLPAGSWTVHAERRYGGTLVTVAEFQGAGREAASSDQGVGGVTLGGNPEGSEPGGREVPG